MRPPRVSILLRIARIARIAPLALVACAASAPPTHYLLRAEAPAPSGRLDGPVQVGLASVAVAAYLDQPGIVLATGGRRVRPAALHLWSEPLEAGLRQLLRAGLSEALGYPVAAGRPARPDYAIDVRVEQLHGDMDGEALIEAAYWIRPAAGAEGPVEYRFSARAPLPREGYPGVVEAEARLARDLARAIADSLRALGAP